MLRRPLATVLSSVSIRHLLTARHFCKPSSSNDDDQITTVRTSGVQFTKDGVSATVNAVYWGQGDPRNTIVNNRDDPTDFKGAMLKAIAKKDGLRRICVETDFKEPNFRQSLEQLKKKDFTTWQGKRIPNSKVYEKLWQYLNEMNVTLEYRSPWLKNRSGNEVIMLITADKKLQFPNANPVNFSSPNFESDWEISPDDVPLEGRSVPTVYVAGRLEVMPSNGYKIGSCASLWAPDTIAHLEIKQRPLGSIQRVSLFPVTYFRMQLVAIYDAIKEAQRFNIPEIRVITDSLHFMHFFMTGWKRTDGSPVANEKFYLKIKALTEMTKVHFKGVKLTDDCDDQLLKKVHDMANDGLGYPMQNRDTKEYDMDINDLLAGKDAVYEVERTSTRRARIFKKLGGCPLGILWDRMDGVPLEGAEAESAADCLVGLGKKSPPAMLLAVLEHADRMGLERIVIRTNQTNLVKSTLGYLEVWHRYDWVDRRYGQVKDRETWKRIWDIKERIEIVWDMFEGVDEVKDEIYLKKYRKRVRQKKLGRPKKKPKGIPE